MMRGFLPLYGGQDEVPQSFFRALQIDSSMYEHDVMIDRGEIRKRSKKPSHKSRDDFGHTPLSVEEDIPWGCARLVIGTGIHGGLQVRKVVRHEAEPRKVELLILPTGEAMEILNKASADTNAILTRYVLKSIPGHKAIRGK